MPVTPDNPITQADLAALATLANTKLLPKVNSAIASNERSWRDSTWGFTSGNIVSFTGINIFDKPIAKTNGSHGILNPQPPYLFDPSNPNWRDEFNRIRGDLMALATQGFSSEKTLIASPSMLVSGPHCVGVNDPITYGMGAYSGQLITQNAYFKNLEFWGRTSNLVGLSISATLSIDAFNDLMNASLQSPTTTQYIFTLWSSINMVGVFHLDIPLNGTPIANNVLSLTSSAFIVSQSVTTDGGGFVLHLVLSITIFGGENTIIMVVNGAQVFGPGGGSPTISMDAVTINGSTPQSIVDAITPSGTVSKLSAPVSGVYGGHWLCFIGNGYYVPADGVSNIFAQTIYQLSNVNVKGVWVAKTLPSPGCNFYLDQDMPPFISQPLTLTSPNVGLIAIGGGAGGISPPWQSSMRQVSSVSSDKINPLKSALSARPTPYIVLRDTDIVPYSYGFNPDSQSIFSNLTSPANGDLKVLAFAVPSNATKVIIRAVKSGTGRPGWLNGVFQYGDALDVPVNIYVRKADFPTQLVYDFKKTDSSVTIPPDGGAGYLASVLNSGFFYGIQSSNGEAVEYDIVTIVETTSGAGKVYFPAYPYKECFSYCLEGTPGIFNAAAGLYFNKPIPKNGYCVFKLRATRTPINDGLGRMIVPSSGAQIVATIGQNKLQAGNVLVFQDFKAAGGVNPFTITIPENARDSGDVAVFWPVIDGGEIIYQCSQRVTIEAWVNFQPTLFNAMTGIGPDPNNTGNFIDHTPPTSTAYQHAMYFVNSFNSFYAGYPATRLKTQFPISADLYNELETCLNLIT